MRSIVRFALVALFLSALPASACKGEGAETLAKPPVAAATPAANTSQPAAGSASSEGAPKAAVAGEVRRIDVRELHDQKDSVKFLVDVRTPSEFASGHVPGALNIPVSDLQARMAEFEPHKADEVHIICQSGARSARAAALLAKSGYKVVDVTDGTHAWRANGFPVE